MKEQARDHVHITVLPDFTARICLCECWKPLLGRPGFLLRWADVAVISGVADGLIT